MSISSLTSAIKAKEMAISKRLMASKPMGIYLPGLKARARKLPVNKNVLLIIGAGIFAICLALLVSAYMAQVDEYNELSDELTSVEQQTASFAAQETLLQQSITEADDQIAQLDSQIIATQAQLTMPLWVSSIFHDLLVVANDNGVVITDGVDITDISSVVGGVETIAGVSYQAVSVHMSVAGPDSNIYNFVDDLSQAFSTGVLKALSVNIDESNADMLFTIYSL